MSANTEPSPRVVTQLITPDQFEDLCAKTSPRDVLAAIGYLSTWGTATYPIARIHVGSEDVPEIQAIYKRTEDGDLGYAIGAVWNGSAFGFHS